MESLAYTLIYVLRGSLPWAGLGLDGQDLILRSKQGTPIDHLCSTLPSEFASFLAYARSLAFEDKGPIMIGFERYLKLYYRGKKTLLTPTCLIGINLSASRSVRWKNLSTKPVLAGGNASPSCPTAPTTECELLCSSVITWTDRCVDYVLTVRLSGVPVVFRSVYHVVFGRIVYIFLCICNFGVLNELLRL